MGSSHGALCSSTSSSSCCLQARGPSLDDTDGPNRVDPVRELTPDEPCCCLAWALAKESADSVRPQQLSRLHAEIQKQARFFEASALVWDATSGVLVGRTASRGMTSADLMSRMGQLLCRWALSQSPPMALYVGVDVGALSLVSISTSGQAWHGPAYAGARVLCSSARRSGMVHLSGRVKEQLSALRFSTMILGKSSTFYLDAFTEVLDEEPSERGGRKQLPQIGGREGKEGKEGSNGSKGSKEGSKEDNDTKDSKDKMSFEAFRELLVEHKVELSKFGTGGFKTLEQFYDDVVTTEKSHLQFVGGSLRRLVELVRISLRFRSSNGKLKELRTKCVANPDGSLLEKDLPLAMVLRPGDAGGWQAGVENCFRTKFGLSPELQKLCFVTDHQAYSYEETTADSSTVPSIPTLYKTHSTTITVKSTAKAELKAIGLPAGDDFDTNHNGLHHWGWVEIISSREEELMRLLQSHGIDFSFSWRSFAELYEEIYDKKQSRLQVVNNELVRHLCVIKVWVCASILNCKHILVVKTKQKEGSAEMREPRTLSMRMREGQSWQDALRDALYQRLGLPEQLQRDELACDLIGRRQEVEYSRSFPGLKTLYDILEVNCEVCHPHDQRWSVIGLPAASDFTYLRKNEVAGQTEAVVTRWGWCVPTGENYVLQPPSLFDKKESTGTVEVDQNGQVLPPGILPVRGSNELLVSRVMEGKVTDWARARRAAEMIRSRDYTTKDFYEDVVAAFPELRLYSVVRVSEVRHHDHNLVMSTSANRSGADEFQRTIGALFCIFWLMRQHLDGRECFCFGLDSEWKNAKEFLRQTPGREAEYNRRMNFYEKANWKAIEELMVGAGLLTETGHDIERTLAMLVLMTIHDIMKLDILRPSVLMAEFCGYKPGDVIGDHDIALSYVLERCPEALPSFAGLLPELQESIRFTHCKLDYNMGWLVQAEAHPGALFRAFRRVILERPQEKSGNDVAFYFVHWFADLAGAEASPLTGCEKFVLKFPLHVLSSFIDSFQVVWKLGPRTETEVLEEYLKWRWGTMPTNLGACPTGAGSVAKMRLVLMAQGDSLEILRQFRLLPKSDANILSKELAITGCPGQHFTCDDLRESRGPALLVYYAPALMQKAGRQDPLGALRILAEVLRQARTLWPLNESDAEKTVLVRIDILKELEVADILEPATGVRFVLARNSLYDGQVKAASLAEVQEINAATSQLLNFNRASFPGFRPRRLSLLFLTSFLSFGTQPA